MQSETKQKLIANIIQGAIIGMFILGFLAMFAQRVFDDHAILLERISEHDIVTRLDRDKMFNEMAMIRAKQETANSNMMLLRVEQEKTNAIAIDMRSRCDK